MSSVLQLVIPSSDADATATSFSKLFGWKPYGDEQSHVFQASNDVSISVSGADEDATAYFSIETLGDSLEESITEAGGELAGEKSAFTLNGKDGMRQLIKSPSGVTFGLFAETLSPNTKSKRKGKGKGKSPGKRKRTKSSTADDTEVAKAASGPVQPGGIAALQITTDDVAKESSFLSTAFGMEMDTTEEMATGAASGVIIHITKAQQDGDKGFTVFFATSSFTDSDSSSQAKDAATSTSTSNGEAEADETGAAEAAAPSKQFTLGQGEAKAVAIPGVTSVSFGLWVANAPSPGKKVKSDHDETMNDAADEEEAQDDDDQEKAATADADAETTTTAAEEAAEEVEAAAPAATDASSDDKTSTDDGDVAMEPADDNATTESAAEADEEVASE